MKFAKFLIAAALILPFFTNAQDSMPVDPSAPPAAPTLNDPALGALPSEGAIAQPAQPSTPAAELGETKKPSKKKVKKAISKKGKKAKKSAKKAKKNKKHQRHSA
jgi:hypothetical protein